MLAYADKLIALIINRIESLEHLFSFSAGRAGRLPERVAQPSKSSKPVTGLRIKARASNCAATTSRCAGSSASSKSACIDKTQDQQIEFWAAETAEQHQDFLQKLREQGRTGLANRGEDATGRENAAWWLQWLEWESLWAHESEHHEGHVNNSLRPQPTLPLQASVCQPVTLSHPPAAVVFVCCQTKRGDRCCLDVVQQHGGKEGDRVKKKLLARKDAEIAGLLARLASAEARCQDKQALEEVRGAAEAGAERMHEEIAGLEHEDEDLKRQQATGSDMQGELGGLLQRAQEPIWSFAKDLEEAQVLARAAHGGKEECEVEVQRMRKEIAGLEQESEDLERRQAKGSSDMKRELEGQLLSAAESISSLTRELEEARGAAGTEAERMREEIAGLEREADDMKRQQAKDSHTIKALKAQLQEAQVVDNWQQLSRDFDQGAALSSVLQVILIHAHACTRAHM